MPIRILSLVIAIVLSGCTAERLFRDNVVPDCPGRADKATSRAAACMTAAMYEIAQKKDETSQDGTTADKDKDGGKDKEEETNARSREWIP